LKVPVNPSVLRWARESAGYSLDDAAEKLSLNVAKLAAAESGDDALSFPQLQKCATVYGRPLAALFIDAPPPARTTLTDFRMHEGSRMGAFSPRLNLVIRRAERQRQDALELAAELGTDLPAFTDAINMTDPVDEVARRVVEILKISPDVRRGWRTTDTALKGWKSSTENLGVLVLEVSRVPSEEMRGMCIPAPLLPIIVLNGGESSAARCFTLLHEFVHVLLRQSAVCDFGLPSEQKIESTVEVFCNAVAGSALVPSDVLAKYIGATAMRDWTHDELSSLSKAFCVSKEVILRRLLTLGWTSRAHYQRMRLELIAEYRKILERRRAAAKETPVKISPAVMAVRNLGYPFVHLVIDAYHRDRIGLATVSDYLGVKVKHLGRIETMMQSERLAA
jgi:Zn-dependent peptidase ImmA (M78 family)